MRLGKHILRLKRLGIATYREAIVYIRQDSYICKAEGFEAQSRIKVTFANDDKYIIATLNMIVSDLLAPDEVGLSEYAWELLGAKEGDEVCLSHPEPLISTSYIRSKVYGRTLETNELEQIIHDIVDGRLADIQIASFLTAFAGFRASHEEIYRLTLTMLNVGERLRWPDKLVVDKHCIGGLPGNRTTLIVVPIVAAFGLTIPKTSSRAISSASGTADTMEVLAPVNLTFAQIQKVVEKEHGCIAWGGLANLSPADDILIRIERSLALESESQMVASILSKKIAVGSTHVLLDIPIGATAKSRDEKQALYLKSLLETIAQRFGLVVQVVFTNGAQPIGRGVGPALEAHDVLQVLQNDVNASVDLREKSLCLAGQVLEFSPKVKAGTGYAVAEKILRDGRAWKKFQAICAAQGGMRTPKVATHKRSFLATKAGRVAAIDNRRIARLAKLAGAPHAPAAGVYLDVKVGDIVDVGAPLLTVHAESHGELHYAWSYLERGPVADGEIVQIA